MCVPRERRLLSRRRRSTTAANRRRNFGIARSEMLGEIIATEFTYFHANSHRRRRRRVAFLPSLLCFLRRSFAFTFLTRIASLSRCHRRHVFCLSAGPRKTVPRISIRRRVSTAFFRMPRGSLASKHAGATEFFLWLFLLFRRQDEWCTRCTDVEYIYVHLEPDVLRMRIAVYHNHGSNAESIQS